MFETIKEMLFDNVGAKLKKGLKFSFWLTVVVEMILCIFVITPILTDINDNLAFVGILIFAGLTYFNWSSILFLYGILDTMENVYHLNKNIYEITVNLEKNHGFVEYKE